MAVTERHGVRQAVPTVARGWWRLVLAGGLLGIVGAVWQTAERLATLGAGGGNPVCEINSVVSCQTAYAYWQTSALGIPNSLIGLPVFAIVTGTAVAALLHPQWSEVGRSARLWTRAEMLDGIGPVDTVVTLDVVTCQRVGEDAMLLVWRGVDDEGTTLRSSL